MAKGLAVTEARLTPKLRARRKVQRRRAQANLEDTREAFRENRKAGDIKGSAGRVVKSDRSRHCVEGATAKKWVATRVRGDGDVEGVRIVGNTKELEEEEETTETTAHQHDRFSETGGDRRDGFTTVRKRVGKQK